MANLSPTSIAKFGLRAHSSHHFPSALPLANEISGTEIDGSIKEDVKEKLEHCVCVCPQLPKLHCFQRAEVSTPTCSAALGTTWSHSAMFPMKGITAWRHWFSSSTPHCAGLTHLNLCCTCNPGRFFTTLIPNFQYTVARHSAGQG